MRARRATAAFASLAPLHLTQRTIDALSLPPQLRGGKFSNWEGGIRVNAFISGGFIPPAARGTVQSGLTAGWDWYATLAGLAGADPTDHRAAAAGLPPIDSIGASRGGCLTRHSNLQLLAVYLEVTAE